ncbi:hypothetical protein Tco_0576430 [Tanacetum coccineum]
MVIQGNHPCDLEAFSDSDFIGGSIIDQEIHYRWLCQFHWTKDLSHGKAKKNIEHRELLQIKLILLAAANCCGQVLWWFIVNCWTMSNSFGRLLLPTLLLTGTLELHATIDTIVYTITEASIRNKLQLADASGITMLPNNEIFEGMGHMGGNQTDLLGEAIPHFGGRGLKTLESLLLPSKTPSKTVNASGEEQVEDISPTTLEAAAILTKDLDFKEVSIAFEKVSTGGIKVSSGIEEINAGSLDVNTGIDPVTTDSIRSLCNLSQKEDALEKALERRRGHTVHLVNSRSTDGEEPELTEEQRQRKSSSSIQDCMKKHGMNEPKDEFEKVLWEYLKNMFEEPLSTDSIWSLPGQQRIICWRYYDACRVHCLNLESADIYMLIERKYPLSAESTMSNRHKDWLVQEQTALGKDFSNPFMADNLPKIVMDVQQRGNMMYCSIGEKHTKDELDKSCTHDYQLSRLRIGMKAVKEKEQLQKTLDSWKDSSKNLWRLINSGMSSNSKIGLGYEIQSNNEVLSVPHPLSGDYTPKPQEEIDESLYVYGKKGPQEPEPSVSDDRSSEYSTCQSNDSAGSIGTSSVHSVDLI